MKVGTRHLFSYLWPQRLCNELNLNGTYFGYIWGGEGVKNDPLKNLPMIKTISTITSTTNKSQNKGDRLIPFEK